VPCCSSIFSLFLLLVENLLKIVALKQRLRKIWNQLTSAGFGLILCLGTRVDTKWRFQFFAKYDYRFLSDAIIAIIAMFFA
jgi:hypothetical protein